MTIPVNKTELIKQFELVGYVVIKLNNSEDLIDSINFDVEKLLDSGDFRTNSKIYSYNNSPRIVEAWKHS